MLTVYVAAPIWEAKAPHLNPVDPSQPYIPAFEVGTLGDTMLLHPDDEIVCLNATELMLLGVWLNPTNRYGGGMKLIRIDYAHCTMKHPFTIKLYKGGYIQVWAVRSEMTNAQHDTLDEPFFSAMDETYVPPRIQNLVTSRMPCKQ